MRTKEANPRRVAIIHDWLVTYRGGEKVLEAIAELYPRAEIFTLFHAPGKVGEKIESHRIHASFLNRSWLRKYYRHTLPLMPYAIESFDLSDFDLVISSSHCVAKGIIPAPDALHICYCHTPMRYAWDRRFDYFPKGLAGAIYAFFLHGTRKWEVTTSSRVDHFIANSTWVARRIEKYYRRSSVVINPFVDPIPPMTAADRGDYYLIVSGFAPYKRIDLAIRACEELGRPLKIVGEGQEEAALRRIAGPQTTFVGRVGGEDLRRIYQGCRALLFPGEEDFGIVPLEAMASGKPVIALGRGGVTDSVIDGKTGVFFSESTVPALKEAILRFESKRFHPEDCRQRAELFSKERFQRQFKAAVDQWWSMKDAAAGNGGEADVSPRIDESPVTPGEA